jgi:putative membrane protein
MKILLLSACILAGGLVQEKSADKELPLPVDQKYLVRAVECAIAEVKLAETALETTKNPEVKKLAQTLEDNHTVCLKKLMAEATKLKIGVVEGLSKDHREATIRLAKLDGNEFDREYVRGVIERHEKLVQCCDGQIKDGKSDGITTMCKEDLVVIKQHLEAARKVKTNLEK